VAVVSMPWNARTPQLPLLSNIVLTSDHPHSEFAECLRLLVDAGADINATFTGPKGFSFTALVCAAQCDCCTMMLADLL
jgi:hypothetical protein